MLTALTASTRRLAATVSTRVGLRRKPAGRELSYTELCALIAAESALHAQREADRQAALDACPAMVDETRAVMRMHLRARACEGDAFALSALRMMAA